MIVGIGLSGPADRRRVVRPAVGQARTRGCATTSTILRQVLRREGPVTHDGPEISLPYDGPGALGQGKALKSILHAPSDIPIWLASVGPRNTELCAELCDGWLPMGLPPEGTDDPDVADRARAGLRPAHRRPARATTSRCSTASRSSITDDVQGWLDRQRPFRATYVGGMGSASHNYHVESMAKRGFADGGGSHPGAVPGRSARGGDRGDARRVPARGHARRIAGAHPRAVGSGRRWCRPGVTGVIVGAERPRRTRAHRRAGGDTRCLTPSYPTTGRPPSPTSSERRAAGRAMGGEERLAKHHAAGQARRPGAHRRAGRSRIVPRARHAHRRRGGPGRGDRAGFGPGRRPPGHRRRRGLHRARRHDQPHQQLEALPRRRARGPRPRAARDDARRRRIPRRREGLRPRADRPARAVALLGSRAADHRGARLVGRATARWSRPCPTSR